MKSISYCVIRRQLEPLDICCGASIASERQHKQDLRRIYKREYEFSKSSLFTRGSHVTPLVAYSAYFFLRGLRLRQVSGYGLL